MGLNVDRTINDIENMLSNVSAYPIIGTTAGCTKIIMGALQTLTALACGILVAIPSAIVRNGSALKYSWTHMKHGIGNMVAGAVEAIPVVQTIVYGIRYSAQVRQSDAGVHLDTGHQFKFMPYSSLVEKDWKFTGIMYDAGEQSQVRFRQKLRDNGWNLTRDQPVSEKRQLELAREVIKGR
jgi:hypothetical protein